ncbi:hypothetical protein VCSRO188_3696 [Vibrio cholerae]|nr:hypothetical protein VCSRO188_3696 [Vibrio cholerae]
METVKKSSVNHGIRKRCQQMTGLHQCLNGLIDVTDEYHGSLRFD